MKTKIINFLKRIKHRFTDKRIFLLKTMPKHGICAEIGAWKGDFSRLILDVSKAEKLYLIDPYKYIEDYKEAWYGGLSGSQENMDKIFREVEKRFGKFIRKNIIEIIREDSAEASKRFPDESLDWVYIDGDHTYEFVKSDINTYFKKVKINGYIAGDDYGSGGWWEGGVKKAVDEFIFEKGEAIQVTAIRDGQFILKRLK